MPQASKSFPADTLASSELPDAEKRSACPRPGWDGALCLQIAVVYGLIEAALWTPVGRVNTLCIALATVCILLFAFGGRFSARQMGIAPPPAAGSGWIVLGGAVSGCHDSAVRSAGQGLWAGACAAISPGWAICHLGSGAAVRPAVVFLHPDRIGVRRQTGRAGYSCPVWRGAHSQSHIVPGQFHRCAFLLRDVSPLPQHFSAGGGARGARIGAGREFFRLRTPSHAGGNRVCQVSSVILSSMSFCDPFRLGFVPPIVRWRAACLARDRTP